jgi:hypothetical protein
MAEAKAVADILAEAEFEPDGFSGYITMDSKDNRLHGYAMPILLGLNLFLHVIPYGGLVCPVCPNHKAHGWIEADARAHVLERAHAPLTTPTPMIRTLPTIAPWQGTKARWPEGIVRPCRFTVAERFASFNQGWFTLQALDFVRTCWCPCCMTYIEVWDGTPH